MKEQALDINLFNKLGFKAKNLAELPTIEVNEYDRCPRCNEKDVYHFNPMLLSNFATFVA